MQPLTATSHSIQQQKPHSQPSNFPAPMQAQRSPKERGETSTQPHWNAHLDWAVSHFPKLFPPSPDHPEWSEHVTYAHVCFIVKLFSTLLAITLVDIQVSWTVDNMEPDKRKNVPASMWLNSSAFERVKRTSVQVLCV